MTKKGMNDLDHTLFTDYPEFEHEYANIQESRTLPPHKQALTVGFLKRKMDGANAGAEPPPKKQNQACLASFM